MWCDRVLYNQSCRSPDSATGRQVDYIDLEWHECTRVLKKRTRTGEDVRVVLSRDQILRHGDVLYDDERRIVAINVMPIEAIVAGPASCQTLMTLVLELGNLHWPTQINDSQVIFPEHEAAMNVIRELDLPWTKLCLRFEPTEVSSSVRVGTSVEIQVSRRVADVAEGVDPACSSWRSA